MRIAVLSGKGGAGKTFVAVNLAVSADHAVYIDCDVEEPNGHLFLKPEDISQKQVSTLLPAFNPEKCTGCRKCVDFCRFNALIYIKKKPKVFPEVCHSCGGCELVCPEGAVSSVEHPVGMVQTGHHKDTTVVSGILNLGEASGVPVIHEAMKTGMSLGDNVIIDCPPGSACPVMESLTEADFAVLVAEPTAFGFHNFKMVYELVNLMHKPCGVVINKMDAPYEPLEAFCQVHELPVLLRIPYDPETAQLGAEGKIICEEDPEMAQRFQELLRKIGGKLS